MFTDLDEEMLRDLIEKSPGCEVVETASSPLAASAQPAEPHRCASSCGASQTVLIS